MVMEHDEALERMEIAAAEPGGLDRLMAGDTADAAAIAGHLAGCPACAAELVAIRRTSAIAREVISSSPDPALRDRTLAFVRAGGVARGAATGEPGSKAEGSPVSSPADTPSAAAEVPAARPQGARRREPANTLRLAIAGLAAALVLAIGAGVVAVRTTGQAAQAELDRQAGEIAVLEETSRATLRITAQPDARRVALAPVGDGTGAAGEIVFSPSTGELVAVASGLDPEAADQEYGCWVEVDGTRTRLGKMYWAGDLWAWAGPVDGLAAIPAGATFGVSLGPAGGGSDAVPILTGEL
jgi:anti-sigma factor RsiW